MKKFLLAGALACAIMPAFAQEPATPDYLNGTYYVIGSKVVGFNDKEEGGWNDILGAEYCKFENKGGGVFEWTGKSLETGFKINNGSWADEDKPFNIGGDGKTEIQVGVPYTLVPNGGENISFDGFTTLVNPKLTLTVNGTDLSLTIEGEKEGVIEWFLAGDFNEWALDGDNAVKLAPVEGKEGVFSAEADLVFPEGKDGNTIVTTTGWSARYGNANEAEPIIFGMGEDSHVLSKVGSFGGDFTVYNTGKNTITWDLNTLTLSIVAVGDAVEEVAVAEGVAEYYNLQGVRVANPENGLFIKVLNGKATKVVVR